MNKKLVLMATLSLVSNLSLACIGGHQASLKVDGQDVAILDKSEKKLILSKDVALTYIGNCRIDNVDADLTETEIDLSGYYEEGSDVCLGLKKGDTESKFKITNFELIAIARSIGPECGGTIKSIKN
jgi:hypothetical protein